MNSRSKNNVATLRAELQLLRNRYDCGAVSPAIYAVIREIEIEIGWSEHGSKTRRTGEQL
jgi:hypothetical protein